MAPSLELLEAMVSFRPAQAASGAVLRGHSGVAGGLCDGICGGGQAVSRGAVQGSCAVGQGDTAEAADREALVMMHETLCLIGTVNAMDAVQSLRRQEPHGPPDQTDSKDDIGVFIEEGRRDEGNKEGRSRSRGRFHPQLQLRAWTTVRLAALYAFQSPSSMQRTHASP